MEKRFNLKISYVLLKDDKVAYVHHDLVADRDEPGSFIDALETQGYNIQVREEIMVLSEFSLLRVDSLIRKGDELYQDRVCTNGQVSFYYFIEEAH